LDQGTSLFLLSRSTYLSYQPDGSVASESDDTRTTHDRGLLTHAAKRSRSRDERFSACTGDDIAAHGHLWAATLFELDETQGGSKWNQEEIRQWFEGVHQEDISIKDIPESVDIVDADERQTCSLPTILNKGQT